MLIERVDLPGGILKVRLTGALDIDGAGVADMPFSIIAGSANKVIVDCAKLTFLASIGIRVLVKTARTIRNRKGVFALFNVSEEARRVLTSTGVDTIIPVVANEATAVAQCSG